MRDVRVGQCCCFTLETGVTILGAIDLVCGILSVICGGATVAKHAAAGSEGLIGGLLLVLVGVCLILAVRNANSNLLIPFLILAGIGTIRIIIQFIIDICNVRKGEVGELIVFLIIYLLIIALAIYFWIVVYSLFKKLKEGTSNRNTSSVA